VSLEENPLWEEISSAEEQKPKPRENPPRKETSKVNHHNWS